MYCIKGQVSQLAHSVNIAEYDTATTNVTVTVPQTGQYYLIVVGAGGGGTQTSYENYYRGAGGGSGACFAGIVSLDAGDYTVTVGAGGQEHYSDNVSSATAGGATTFTNSAGTVLVSAGGGTGARVIRTAVYRGEGGTLELSDSLNIIKAEISSNGNAGSTNFAYNAVTTAYGGDSLYKEYGKGGTTIYLNQPSLSKGRDGYMVLSVVQTDFTSPVMTSNGVLGGDSFAIAGNTGSTTIYSITTPNGYSMWGVEHITTLTFYNPLPMQINKVTWSNPGAYGSVVSGVKGWGVYESKDNVTWEHIGDYYSTNTAVSAWTSINFPATNSKYFRLVWLGAVGSNGGYSNAYNLALHGTVTSTSVSDSSIVKVRTAYLNTIPIYYKKVTIAEVAQWQICTQEDFFAQSEENRKIRYNYYALK